MESQYGIAVTNKYELFLNEDEDPLEILRLQEEAKLKKKDDKPTKKDGKHDKAAKSAKTKQNKKVLTPVQDQKNVLDPNIIKKDDKSRNRPTRDQGDDKLRKPRENRDGFNREPFRENRDSGPPRRREDRGDRERNDMGGNRGGERGRGFGRGRGGGRGGGRGRGGSTEGGFDRFGKRDFERHSGSDKTGVKAVDKREGGGAHNWGNVRDDIENVKATNKRDGGGAHNWGSTKDDIQEQLNDTNVSESNPEWSATEETENREPKHPLLTVMMKDPWNQSLKEPAEMTLDEYREMERKNRVQAAFKIRRAGEGVDGDQWKKTYVLKKTPQEEEDEEEYDEEEYEERHGRPKNILDIEITFSDNPRRGRGRRGGTGVGGRGRGGFGGRGGRGGGGGFGGRGREGGFGGRGDREGGFGSRGDREGGFGSRGDREGGFGSRGDREGGFGSRGDRDHEGGFGSPDAGGGGGGGGFGAPRGGGGFGSRGGRGGEGGGFGSRGGEGGGFGGPRGGGFRGREGGRGRGGRDSRPPRKSEEVPNVEDEQDFPSLGKAVTS
ncbi:hypothetical protein NP493_49g09075 [Ridgeia piscesae]|uniref:Hyaluronan/mRNA-binding protein domain-containing protein n=1 Tax=Ridgeia piscesae TaxID=27915 RepID=A0AAD9UJG8_RIDPI|nr:hypothetical protein NP493_49g09075 [Ridgeia piscesae]